MPLAKHVSLGQSENKRIDVEPSRTHHFFQGTIHNLVLHLPLKHNATSEKVYGSFNLGTVLSKETKGAL